MFTTDRKISYYASKLSDNIFKTPEGYLVCKNVPIARTGIQEYLGQELGLNDKYDEYIKVYREPEDVFAEEAIASFEGKTLTDEHPVCQVDVNNISQFDKGHVQNVRRSTENPDLLVADIIAQDATIISEIENKIKREISCGYDCYYVPYKDGYRQVEIRGNHIALVTKGRAGSRVSIKDNKLSERKGRMAKKNILAAMLKAFAKDAEPEELAEAMDAINEKEAPAEVAPAKAPEAEETAKDEDPLANLASRLDSLEAMLSKLVNAEKEEGHEGLDEDPENVMDEDPEEDKEEVEEKEEVEDEEIEEEEEVRVSKDSLAALKSAVAKIRNPQDKKRASDALSKAFGKTSSKNVYDGIMKTSQKALEKNSVKDSSDEDKLANLGREIAKNWNPHYKENK